MIFLRFSGLKGVLVGLAMAWRLMSWDLADYLLVLGPVPSVPPPPGRVSFESYFHNFLSDFFLI